MNAREHRNPASPQTASSRLILGVDPGTAITGYGLVDQRGQEYQLRACGVIRLGKMEVAHPEKLKRIQQRILGLIDQFAPDEMAIEAPFYDKNVQSMLKLGRAQGVVIGAALSRGLTVEEYAPRKVKKAITGSGHASKEQVAGMVEKLFPTILAQPTEEVWDAYDAVAVAVCHALQRNAILPGASGSGGKTKGKSGWEAFVQNHPDRVGRR